MDISINFYGFVEGNDICAGTVDVVVTDGFTGNIALKTAEGTLKMCVTLFKESFAKTLFSKLGYLLARRSLRHVKEVLNPDKYSGGIFLGLNGISVKSHGSSSAEAFANSINLAVELAEYDINAKILDEIQFGEK